MNFGDCPSHFPSIVLCGEVSQSVYDHAELLTITGSSSNDFYPNINCMYTILLYDIQTSIVFVDYGISERELKKSGRNDFSGFSYYELGDFLPSIIELCNKYGLFTKINFEKHYSIKNN